MAGRGSSVGPVASPATPHSPFGSSYRSTGTATLDDAHADAMTTIIPLEELREAERRSRRQTSSEITQDILIPEAEFEQYRAHSLADVTIDAPSSGEIHLPADGSLVSDGPTDAEAAKPFRTTSGGHNRPRGRHRLAAPPAPLRGGRAALVAMAAGAAVAAVAQAGAGSDAPTPTNATAVTGTEAPIDLGPGIAPAAAAPGLDGYTEALSVGQSLADEQAAREAAARRPLFFSPIELGKYSFTSAFASRWGTFHGGIDMAAPLGTPIHAVTDGVVIEAGPASGYGNWVQIQAADGTVTMYGHMSSAGVLVQKGQQVTAGDTIGLVGNEGFSTGPHVHFEVWKNGSTKIDPVPWLAQNGIRMSAYGS